MLYLKSLTIDRFKSFNRAELSFSKGFTCIVGPNGSGKSAILDSLLLGLGETSLQRLRVSSLEGLITNNLKNKGSMSKAHIRMEFSGDQEISVLRMIRADGKSAYKVNGKHMSRREVMDMLSRYGVRADDTTTIAQGEINDLIELNPKERRELIDIAAGIKEFEVKKQEALRELEKVDNKISESNVALSERMIVLRELEKEKEAAEAFTKLTARLRSVKYTILMNRKEELQQLYDSCTKEMALLDSKASEAGRKAEELAKRIEQFSSERQLLTKELNESQSSMSEIGQRLDMLNKDSAKAEAELASARSALADNEKALETIKKEGKAASERMAVNKSALGSLKAELSKVEKEIELMDIEMESGELEKKMEKLNAAVTETEAKMLDSQSYVSKLHADLSSLEKQKSELEARLAAARKQIKENEASASAAKGKAEDSRGKQERSEKEGIDIERSIIVNNREMETIDSKHIELIAQRAAVQSREGNISAKLSEQFSEKDGFYGRASQLCSYKAEHATAVETCAGSRLEYFVVDSISTANAIITHLKKNGLGRATFIPIKELNVERQQRALEGLEPLLGVVKYDQRFSRVFEYVFSNTYIIDNIENAKKFGIGKHRYVTLEGELVEQSGTVSGGSQKRRVSLASIENGIKAYEADKARLRAENESMNKRLSEKRREQAALAMDRNTAENEIASLAKERKGLESAESELSSFIEDVSKAIEGTRKEMEAKDREKMELADALAKSRDELSGMISRSMSAGKKRKKAGNAEAERYATLNKAADEMKIKAAQLGTENSMLEDRAKALDVESSSKTALVKQLKEQIKENEIKAGVLAKSRAEIENRVKHSNTASKKAYERLSALDSESGKLGAELARLNAEIDNLNRQLGDVRLKRSASETRLNDIAVELPSYAGTIERIKGSIDQMQAEEAVVSAKLGELGNVNLKAPEAYVEKSRNVEEAQAKVNTLQVEKQAVLRMMEDIDSKKLQTFMHTLNEVNRNFTKLYSYIFPETATIKLDNEQDPLNSGLDISLKSGSKERRLGSLSGGESSIVSLVLMFAIHTSKPSALYIFDEIDSALDKENSKKLSLLIKQMSKDAQFVVVSHNDSLIVNADAAIGVVKTNGISSAVGIDIASISSKQK
ncbi:MAG: chromosome segregation protein SMC [Candidatus Micrarchaeota archaeon]|nr:chromosome segregation protein SMC [Candidatus Micrarchaeota archaeon]